MPPLAEAGPVMTTLEAALFCPRRLEVEPELDELRLSWRCMGVPPGEVGYKEGLTEE